MLFFDFILCDRYLLDTLIDFKINFPRIKLNKNVLWILLCKTIVQPDLALMLILPFLESQKRLSYKEPFLTNMKLLNIDTFYILKIYLILTMKI